MKKDILYILDLDRTLIDVDRVMEVTEEVCNELGVDFKKIYKDQKDLSRRGTAYSPFGYISGNQNVRMEHFKKRFIELSANGRIFFADSQKIIDKLENAGADFVILTHGVDNDWQILKIRAANLENTPYIIVKDRYKGRFISSWLNQTGNFSPDIEGIGEYKKCVFIDDRKEAFVDLPDNCQGYLLDRPGKIKPDTELPGNSQIIRSLTEVEI